MDGEGNPDTEIIQCEAPDGYVDNALDCDDTTRAVRTSAPDACDGLDNDCDGIVDNNCVSDDTDDEDGKGAAGSSTSFNVSVATAHSRRCPPGRSVGGATSDRPTVSIA